MKNTQSKIEDVFTEVFSKATISTEQMTSLNNFLAKII